jgi:cytochrome c553
MKTMLPACLLALILIAAGQSAIAAKSDSCAHCHGTDGNSTSSAYPSLAGQTREYLYRQIKAFKEGQRRNAMMSPAVAVLSDQDTLELAEYFSGQTLVRSTAKTDPDIVRQGKQISAEAQCVVCHQPNFKGLDEFPRVSRQKYPYLVKQLKDFRDGVRTSEVMGPTMKAMTDAQIEALAQYLTSL